MLFDIEIVFSRIPAILGYLPVTAQLVLISTFLSLLFGFGIALIKIHDIPVLKSIAALYVSFARGTPAIIQLYLAFYGVPMLASIINQEFGTALPTIAPPLVCAIVAFTFNEAAYSSESIRSALQAVDKGQWEAAKSIGMSPWQTYRKIILPEALVIALPPLGNAFIGQIKNTSLAFTCAVIEMTAGAKLLASHDYRYFEAYVSLAIIYYVITLIVSRLLFWSEKKLKKDEGEVVENAPKNNRFTQIFRKKQNSAGN